MLVRELSPGSTVADLVPIRKSDMDCLAVNSKFTNQKKLRVKVNHEFVENLEQKLKMGDFVEVIPAAQPVISVGMTPVRSSSIEKPCGKIALEFQREQLKRLYGGISTDDLRTTSLERSPSVAGLI